MNDRIPDDATTIAMKRAGVYGYVVGGGCCFIGLLVLWLIREEFRMKRSRAELHRLQERIAQMRAEDAAHQRRRQADDLVSPRR